MANVYDIAANQVQARPVSSFLLGREAAVNYRRDAAYAGQVERQNEITDQDAPLRAKEREAASKTIDYNGVINKITANKAILASITDQESLDSARMEMEKIDPKIAEKLNGNYDRLKPWLDDATGAADPALKSVKDLQMWEDYSKDPNNPYGPNAAKVYEAKKAAFAAEAQAEQLKLDKAYAELDTEASTQYKNYAAANASAAKAQESLAGAAKKNAEAVDIASGKPSDAKPPKSATEAELKQATARIEADAGFARLDDAERPKAAAWIAGRAKQIQEEQPDKIYADAQELAMAEARGKLSTQKVPMEGIWDEWRGNTEEKPVFGGSVDNAAVLAMAKDAIAKGKDPDAVRQLLRDQYGIEDADL